MPDTKSPPQFIKLLDTVCDFITRICIVLAAVALVAMTVFYVWLVYWRYVLNDTPTWVEQVSLLLVMVITILGAAVGVHEHTHLSVNILRSGVAARIRTVFVVITDLIMGGFGALMMWYGAQLTLFKWGSLIPLIGVPEGLRSLPLTISGGLILLFTIGHLVRLFAGADERRDSIE